MTTPYWRPSWIYLNAQHYQMGIQSISLLEYLYYLNNVKRNLRRPCKVYLTGTLTKMVLLCVIRHKSTVHLHVLPLRTPFKDSVANFCELAMRVCFMGSSLSQQWWGLTSCSHDPTLFIPIYYFIIISLKQP